MVRSSVLRPLKWLAIVVASLIVLAVIVFNLPNWNWLRDPIAHQVHARTGRDFAIHGDLVARLRRGGLHLTAADVTFSNPAWAHAPNMFSARNVAVDLGVLPLLRRHIVLNGVDLGHAQVFLEKSPDGRRNWLLDRNQQDERSGVTIRRLTVEDGQIEFIDPAQGTDLRAHLATRRGGDAGALPLQFEVGGRYLGKTVVAAGAGSSVLTLRDEHAPYRLQVGGRVGPVAVTAVGQITNLLALSQIDLQLGVGGGSLEQLYDLIGVVFPETPPYTISGRLIHSGKLWRFEQFKGRIGESDIAGTFQVQPGEKRPMLVGTFRSKRLDLGDLGPLVGTGQAPAAEVKARGKVLPDTPFHVGRWNRMDADVTLDAQSIKRPGALPIENLFTHLRLDDGVVTLSPLRFGAVGGTIAGSIRLDGNKHPIHAAANLTARKIKVARLAPSASLPQTSIREFNGSADLKGRGNSVAAMLGSADGELALVVSGGEISQLMMEELNLHLLKILQLKVTGDQPVRVRCGVADFGVEDGVMQARTLVLDTDIARVDVTGDINLGSENLDLTLLPKSKKFSLISLRTPIHVQGPLASPAISIDKGKLALRALGAAALGAANPALALVPLIEAGPGTDSDCGRLIREADRDRPQARAASSAPSALTARAAQRP